MNIPSPAIYANPSGKQCIKANKIAVVFKNAIIVLERARKGTPLKRVPPWIGRLSHQDFCLCVRFGGAQLEKIDPAPKEQLRLFE